MRLRLLLTTLSLTPLVVKGQTPDTVRLSPIVVTATRFPYSAASVSVTVLSGAALRAQNIATVADALRLVPGASVVATGSFGGQTSLFLRGGESDYVKVLIDGVPQNQPGGFFDFANLGTEDVERIEIVRGPVSVLYGSDAVTGVVHVITSPRGGGAPAARLSVGTGASGTAWGEASVSGGNPWLQYGVIAARRTTKGIYAFNNDYRRDLVGARLQLDPDARTTARLVARYSEGVFHFPTDYIGTPADSDQHTSSRGPSLGLELRRAVSRRVETHLSAAYHREAARYDDGSDSPGDTSAFCCFHSRDVLHRLLLGGRADVHLSEATILSGGIELERQRQEGSTLNTARRNAAAYVQAVAEAGPEWSVTLGARLDENQRFGRHTTARVGVAWRADPRTRAHLSAGTGFKEPSFLETFASGFARGNSALRPEHTTSWEIGVSRLSFNGKLAYSVTYFDQRFGDLIQYSAVPVGPDSVNYINVADASARGLELWTSAAAGALAVEASYTALRTRDVGTGLRLLRRPNHTVALRVSGRYSARGRVDLTARHTGARDDQDFAMFPATVVRLAAHTVVDAGVAHRVVAPRGGGAGLRVTARVTNLFDARYEEVRHFRTPRRSLVVGGELSLGG